MNKYLLNICTSDCGSDSEHKHILLMAPNEKEALKTMEACPEIKKFLEEGKASEKRHAKTWNEKPGGKYYELVKLEEDYPGIFMLPTW
jgi:hypothetical protein